MGMEIYRAEKPVNEEYCTLMGKNAQSRIPWSELPIFLTLAREKTLSGAARRLNIDRTTVARRIDTLEATVERALFDRLDGKFELTPLGRRAFAAAERAHQELSLFDKPISGERHTMGKVRLSLPAQFSLTLVEPLARFERENPDILLELAATDRIVSLHRYETDVALRLSSRAPHDLASHDLGQFSYRYYHSANAAPDLTRYITYPGGSKTMAEVRDLFPNAEVVMSVDGYIPLREYIAQGVGFGILSTNFGDADPRLMPVSEPIVNRALKLWLVCLPDQRRLYRIQKLVQFLRSELKGAAQA
jgi:DNA-binding transcriptional LysR family regulator